MKNKYFFLVIIIIALCLPAFASQKLYNNDSYEVLSFKALKRISHDNIIEPSYPINSTQLLELLKQLSVDNLDDRSLSIYNNLCKKINSDNEKQLLVDGNVAIGLYGRSSDKLIDYDKLYLPIKDRIPFINVQGTFFSNDYLCGLFSFENTYSWKKDDYNKKFILTHPFDKHDEKVPWHEYLSLGYDKLNLFVGRERLSAGNGRKYNVFMGDNFRFEEAGKLSIVKDNYSYDLTLIAFDDENDLNHVTAFDFEGKDELLANHRFSYAFNNYFTVTLYEAMLEYGSNTFNLRILNPFMIMHNLQSWASGNNNNLYGIELSSNIGKGYEINLQLMFDQIQSNDEIESQGKGKIPPNAGAALINLVYSQPYKNGLVDIWCEGVWTTPGCYLKEQFPRYNEQYRWYQVDLLFGTRSDGETLFEYLGYKYGPNTIGLNLGLNYFDEDLYLELNADYHYTGTYRKGDYINTDWQYYYKFLPICIGQDKVFEHDIVIGAKAKYSGIEGITLVGSLGYLNSFNYNNIKKNHLSDLQFSFGIDLNLFQLAKKKYPVINNYIDFIR